MHRMAGDSFTAFFPKMTGSLEVSGPMLPIRGEKHVQVSLTHVVSFQKTGAAPMGKVNVQLGYYDAFGNAETLFFAMRDADYHALKQKLGK